MGESAKARSRPGWMRSQHGTVLVLGGVPLLLFPDALGSWPFPLLIPLCAYGLIVGLCAPLRRTADWMTPGVVTPRLAGAAVLLAVATAASLLTFERLSRPDLAPLDAYLPLDLLGSVALTAVVFSLVNAVLEESIFRGVLFQAVEARWNWLAAALITSAVFGLGHLGGYPSGAMGGVLAGVFGLAVAVLRHCSKGLLLPVLVHAIADATITWIRIDR